MKGNYNEECNTTACSCQGVEDKVIYYNKATLKYYCPCCARELNRVNSDVSLSLYGSDLCVPLSPEQIPTELSLIVDLMVKTWHSSKSGNSTLMTFLGLSPEEYQKWVSEPTFFTPDMVIAANSFIRVEV